MQHRNGRDCAREESASQPQPLQRSSACLHRLLLCLVSRTRAQSCHRTLGQSFVATTAIVTALARICAIAPNSVR